MFDFLIILTLLLTYVLASIKFTRRASILCGGAALATYLHCRQLLGNGFSEKQITDQILSYINLPILTLVITLEVFSIIIIKTQVIDRVASLMVSPLSVPKMTFIDWRKRRKFIIDTVKSISKVLIIKPLGWVSKTKLRLQICFLFLVYVVSLFMNNLAAIVVILPFALRIGQRLGFNDLEKFTIFLIISSNLGGASLLIGDFPNMVIATHTHAAFLEFAVNLGAFILPFLVLPTLIFYYYNCKAENKPPNKIGVAITGLEKVKWISLLS